MPLLNSLSNMKTQKQTFIVHMPNDIDPMIYSFRFLFFFFSITMVDNVNHYPSEFRKFASQQKKTKYIHKSIIIFIIYFVVL